MKYFFLFTAILLALGSCNHDEEFKTSSKLKQLRDSISEDSYRYNQVKIQDVLENILTRQDDPFAERKTIYDSFYTPLFYKLNLKTVKEYSKNKNLEVYQFRYWRAFNPEYCLFTIIHDSMQTKLFTHVIWPHKKCRKIINKPMHRILDDSCIIITKNKETLVDDDHWYEFLDLIDDNEFWSLRKKDNRLGLDGSGWTIEGLRSDFSRGNNYQNYHLIERWTPKKEHGARKIGEYLIKLSGENIGKVY